MELGAYNITYEPRNAIKGQVLADFVSETFIGESNGKYFEQPAAKKKEEGKWLLYTDGASNNKGSGAGLVLISPE